jgi:GT2 family glycosyltransferase
VPRVSVIVPIFNGVDFLPAFFESLNAALPAGSEVVLVDDASTEAIWDTVPDLPAADAVVRLQNDHNVGYSATVNRGFERVTGEIVVQLNTDLVLEAECIRAMVGLISERSDAGIVGSKLVYPASGLAQHVGMAFGEYSKLNVFSELPADHPLCSVTREVQIMTGATVATTRRTLETIGPLHDGYFNVNDDIEHCLLARQHGLRNFVCADSVAYHWKSHSGPARFARLASGEARFWSRWGDRYEIDLGRFVDEALDQLLSKAPDLEGLPFEILDLSRGADQRMVIDRLASRWPGVDSRLRRFRQTNNLSERLALPLVVPHWTASEPVPFIYLVDRYRELEENSLWFRSRSQVVAQEVVVDLTGAVVLTSELHRG